MGMAGGVMSSLQGGKFGHGFVSAGTGAVMPGMVGKYIEGIQGQTVAAALVGGTVSAMTGGKFANGAAMAAFSYAASNAGNRGRATGSGDGPSGLVSVPDQIMVEETGFSTPSAAAKAFGDRYSQQGVDERAEYQVGIVRIDKGNFGYVTPGMGPPGATIVDPAPLFNAIRGAGFRMVAWAHTHFDSNMKFSGTDMQFVKDTGGTLFMTNRAGETYRLTPGMLKQAASGYKGVNKINKFIQSVENFKGQRVP